MEKKEEAKDVQIGLDQSALINEFTYRRYKMNKVNLRRFFDELSTVEYIVMYEAEQASHSQEETGKKVYLAQIAKQLQLPIHEASKLVGNLRDRGLVTWTHDGDGSEGTYICITSAGAKTLEKQGKALKEFFGTVIPQFGEEHLIELLRLMKELEEIMENELGEKKGEKGYA